MMDVVTINTPVRRLGCDTHPWRQRYYPRARCAANVTPPARSSQGVMWPQSHLQGSQAGKSSAMACNAFQAINASVCCQF
ncbi:hypothetical protein IU993_003872 [Escherichia coli]|nr:hypothetical protein [Escherichia coli]